MPSSTDSISTAANRSFRLWNRRTHIWIGLFTLVFVWFCGWTGLLLNHQWQFAEFWDTRKQSSLEREIVAPPSANDLLQARDILRQLALTGEIEWTATRGDGGQFDFRVSRPGQIIEIKADLNRNHVSVQRIDVNTWGVMRILHTFTGVRMDDPRNQRDWFVTTLWAYTMDAVAVGLILLVLTGIPLWWDRVPSRRLGGVFLATGALSCGLFWFGLRWIY